MTGLRLLRGLRFRNPAVTGPTDPPPPPPPPQGSVRYAVGLFDRKGVPQDVSWARTHIKGGVHEIRWVELQPDRRGQVFPASTSLDDAIATYKSLGLQLKLRIMAGSHAPAWVKNLGGPPLSLYNPADKRAFTMGRPWRDDYQDCYAELVDQIADRWGAEQTVVDVTISGCMFHYAEPDIRMIADKPDTSLDDDNKQIMWDAGYRKDLDLIAQRRSIDAHKAFAGSGISQSRAYNAFQWFERRTDGSGTFRVGTDLAAGRGIMDYQRTALGAKVAVLGNNSLDDPVKSSNVGLYDDLAPRGGPLYFQTENTSRIDSIPAAVDKGVELGAMMIELPGVASFYTARLTAAEAAADNTALAGNVPS